MDVTEKSFIECLADARRLRELVDRWLPVLEHNFDASLPAWERAQLWRAMKAASLGKPGEAVPYPVRPSSPAIMVDGQWREVVRATPTGYLVRGEGDGMIDAIKMGDVTGWRGGAHE